MMQLTREIHALVSEEKLDADAAIRLMLEAQLEILQKLQDLDQRLQRLENVQEDSPSWLWLWKFNRKDALLQTLLRFGIGLAFFWPLILPDTRQPVVELIKNLLF